MENNIKGVVIFDNKDTMESNCSIEVNMESNFSKDGSAYSSVNTSVEFSNELDVINIIIVYATINDKTGQIEIRTKPIGLSYDNYYDNEFYSQNKLELVDEYIDEIPDETIIMNTIKIISIINEVQTKYDANDRYSSDAENSIKTYIYEL